VNEAEREHKEFLAAAAAVYAWVSAADGEISPIEIEKFIEYLSGLDFFDEISENDFNEYYLTILEAFQLNFEDGHNRALARIETFKGDIEKSKALIRTARKALLADNNLNEAEEAVIDEIEELLGVNEETVD